jgi:Putative zinc-finger
MKEQFSIISCDAAFELMSPFVDSMVTAEEAESLQSHTSQCKTCRRQLQSFISVRNLMAGVEPVPVPEDLQLDTRVRLSHERLRNGLDRWQSRYNNMLRPFAVPAFMGIVLTLLGFSILLASLASPRGVMAEDTRSLATVATAYQFPKTSDPTLRRLGAIASPELDQVLSTQMEVSRAGRVDDFSIIAGKRTPGVDQWLQELVLLSQFRPATYWGLPVRSRVIISFVTVRG